MPWRYYDIMRNAKDRKTVRYQVVAHALEHGVKPAAKRFRMCPKTVRKWRDRFEEQGWEGLKDRSRAPKNPANRVSDHRRRQAVDLKKRFPGFGAERLRRGFGLSVCPATARKIWREEGLLKRRRRKHKTKQNLREVKRLWRLFEQTCVDTKDLDDIPELWPAVRQGAAPKIQYTAREVTSGMQFLAYADERALCYATLFARRVIAHLQACGVDLAGCRFQTDNGSEFIGAWNAKQDSAFTRAVQAAPGLEHHTIPPGAHTWQSDVETVHNLIETELYEVQPVADRQDFLEQAAAYNAWFNVARTNSYKENKTPWQLAHERNPNLDPRLPLLPPVYLDQPNQGGDDVVAYPSTDARRGKLYRHRPPLRDLWVFGRGGRRDLVRWLKRWVGKGRSPFRVR